MGSHSVSAGAVVVRQDGRLLAVQRRDTGAWVTPGGVLEQGETVADAATREVFEETGVEIEVGSLAGVYQNLSTDVVTFVFRAVPVARQRPRASEESSRVRWMMPSEAEALMTDPFITRIRDAFTDGPPVLRTIAEPHLMAPKPQRP